MTVEKFELYVYLTDVYTYGAMQKSGGKMKWYNRTFAFNI